MLKTKYAVSSFQVFFLVFSYVFSGLFLRANASVTATVLSCAFAAAICAAAQYLCESFSSSSELYFCVFGKWGSFVRWLSLAVLSFAAMRALYDFSRIICSYYKGASVAAVFFVCVFLSVFAVFRSFSGAARFSELGAFAVPAIVLLCFLGNAGQLGFSFSREDVLSAFDCFPSSAVIFSLYLRMLTPLDDGMSDFARNTGKHPSPALCGITGSFAAGALYLFICAMGGMSNILLLVFAWLLCLAGFFARALCVSDLLGIPECEKEKAPRRVTLFALLCAAVLLFSEIVPEWAYAEANAVYNLLLPCVLFAVFFAAEKKTSRANVNK